jgi:hypothetical protein
VSEHCFSVAVSDQCNSISMRDLCLSVEVLQGSSVVVKQCCSVAV